MYYKYIYTFAAQMITKLARVAYFSMPGPLNKENHSEGET